MKRYQKIIFVDEDNICESIMAEAILKNIIGERPLKVISRGLVVLFPEPLNPKATTVLEENNLRAWKRYSEELQADEITEDSLILTMRESQVQKIEMNLHPDCDMATLRGFVGYKGDLPSPSGDMEVYGNLFETMDLLVKAAAQLIFEPIDEELANEPKPLSPAMAAQLVRGNAAVSPMISQAERLKQEEEQAREEAMKQQREQEMEEEYLQIVQKTAEREAAREAAKEAEVSEYKLLYEEIKEKKNQKKQETDNCESDC